MRRIFSNLSYLCAFASSLIVFVLYFSVAPQTKVQFNALANSFKMAWKIIRSSLNQHGKYFLFFIYHKALANPLCMIIAMQKLSGNIVDLPVTAIRTQYV